MNLTIFVPEKHRKEVQASKKRLNLSKLFLAAFLEWKTGKKFQEAGKDADKLETALRRISRIAKAARSNGKKEKEKTSIRN